MIVIVAVAFANGEHCPHAGQYLESFDHEAYHGRGYATFTSDVAKAKKFKTKGDAFAFWKRRSLTKPTRKDGKPNRPMTGLTVTILDETDEWKPFPGVIMGSEQQGGSNGR